MLYDEKAIFAQVYRFFPIFQASCVYEFQLRPPELLCHAIILATDSNSEDASSPKVLDSLLQFINTDLSYDSGSMHIIFTLCAYALRQSSLSVHDSDTILDFLCTQNSTKLPKHFVDALLKFSSRALYTDRCIEILSNIPASSKSNEQILSLCEGAQSENESLRYVSLQTLATIYSENTSLLTNNSDIIKLAWINSHDDKSGIAKASSQILTSAAISLGVPDDTLALLTHENQSFRKNAIAAHAHSLQGKYLSKGLDSLLSLFVKNSPDKGSMKKKAVALPEVKKTTKKTVVKKKPKVSNIGGIAGIGQPTMRKKKVSSKLTKDALKPKAVKSIDKSDLILGNKASKDNEDSPSKQQTRTSVISCLAKFPMYSVEADVVKLVNFLSSWAICDQNRDVRNLACKTMSTIVTSYTNSENVEEVMRVVKDILKNGNATDTEVYEKKSPSDVESSDYRKEGAVIALVSRNFFCDMLHYSAIYKLFTF